MDAASGFWQIPLDSECVKLTTFITPFGRYCFNRLPFGITSAPEIFQFKMNELLEGLEGVVVYMDDILVYGSNMKEHDERLSKVLHVLKENGLKLNDSKCHYRQSELKFLGQSISKDGVGISRDKVAAIQNLAPPTNVTELKRALGMINYLCSYIDQLSTVLKPLNDLLKCDVYWFWGPEQEAAFAKVKDLISTAPVLAYFDPTKITVVSADASSYGLGGVLLQYHGKELRPVAFASRTLSQAEKGYAQIEKECLAGVWCCEKFDKYLRGLDFKLFTEHKPLVPLINMRDLDKVPIRCQRLLIRMMRYNPEAQYVPGKQLVVADTLSRAPQPGEISEIEWEIAADIAAVEQGWPLTSQRLSLIREATQEDEELSAVFRYTDSGWPSHASSVAPIAQPYCGTRGHLSIHDGLITYDDRLIIPHCLRADVLQKIHEGHQGITKCRERAHQSVWWPKIGEEIVQIVQQCAHCQKYKPTTAKEPMVPTVLPDRPWQMLGVDLLDFNGQQYMVVVDYYSRYIELVYLADTITHTVTAKLKCIFARFGIPHLLVSDNGPQFSSKEFRQFADLLGFTNQTSSPYYPQANGQSERAVQVAKTILRQSDPMLALLAYRSTPHVSTGFSPAQLLMGRRIQSRLPTLPSALQPKWPNSDVISENDRLAKESSARFYNRKHGAKPLTQFEGGESVRIKTDAQKVWGNPTVVVRADTPRSYIVQSPDGSTFRRNRRHLQEIPVPVTERQFVPDVASNGSPAPHTPKVAQRPKVISEPIRGSQVIGTPKPTVPTTTTRSGRVSKPAKRLDL